MSSLLLCVTFSSVFEKDIMKEELRNPLLQDSLNMTKFMQLASDHKCFSSMHGTPLPTEDLKTEANITGVK